MAQNINLEIETIGQYTGKVTAIQVTKYDYDKYGLQLYDDLSYNLNFQTFDIENLENRAATYSKTLKLPGTHVNNQIFSHLYDLDISIPTNSSLTNLSELTFFGKRIECELLYDSIPIKEGFFELKKVYYNESQRQIEYEGEFYSKSKSFSETVGDKLLYGNEEQGDDLDFSEYDHPLTFENFVASHSAPYYTTSTGYYYPIIDYANLEEYNFTGIESFRPSLYVKEVIDKIFEKAGYSYNSGFFNGQMFKSLVLPWIGDVKLDDETVEARNLVIGMLDKGAVETDFTGNGPKIWGDGTNWDYRDFYCSCPMVQGGTAPAVVRNIPLDKDDPNPPYYNSANEDFDTVAHRWTCPAKGKYRISWTAGVEIYLRQAKGGVPYYGPEYFSTGDKQMEVKHQIYQIDPESPGVTLLCEQKTLYQLPISIDAGDSNSFIWAQDITMDWSGTVKKNVVIYPAISIRQYNPWSDSAGRIGMEVLAWADVKDSTGNHPPAFEVTAEPGFTLYEGEIVNMTKCLPPGMTQMDFFKNIINMFNLVVDEVPNTDKTLLIETRDDYYFSGTTLDWTDKEDISQAQEIERIETLINKDFALSYKSDKDDLNVRYEEDNRKLIYGNYKVKNPYQSIDTYEVNVDFSPTPLSVLGYTNWGVSKICATDDRGNVKEETFNPRILYRQNITASGRTEVPEGYLLPYYITYSGFSSASFGWSPFHGGTDYEYQPYAGHFDTPYNPTLDLNFGLCKTYYYPYLPKLLTTNNIYENYWKNYVAELIDINSKKVTKYFKLTIDDIYNLSFSSKVWVDGVQYILEKINDWNPGAITKVEMMKLSSYDLDKTPPADWMRNTTLKFKRTKKKQNTRILDLQQPFNIHRIETYGIDSGTVTGGTFDYNSLSARTSKTWQDTFNRYPDNGYGIIIGDNNKIATNDGIFIKGSNNIIEEGASNISIFGSDVIIKSGTTNVVVLANDTTGNTITQSNFVYLPSGYTINNIYTKDEVDSKITSGATSGVSLAYLQSNYYDKTTVDTKTGNTYIDARSYTDLRSGQTYIDAKAYTDLRSGQTKAYTDATYTTKGGVFNTDISNNKATSSDAFIISTNQNVTVDSSDELTGRTMFIINTKAGDLTITAAKPSESPKTSTLSQGKIGLLIFDGSQWGMAEFVYSGKTFS